MQATAKEVKLTPVKKGKKTFSVFPFVNGLFFLLFCLFRCIRPHTSGF